jgi:hypothetical protein
MTQDEALKLVRQLLQARDESALMNLVAVSLPAIDGTFFAVASASVQELERTGKGAAAQALRNLSDRMLRMKTLI